jgi:hypothetical protein
MFFGTGATRSSIQAAGRPGGGFSASPNALVDPGGGPTRRGFQRVPESARRAGHDKRADMSARRLFEQDQRSENVGLDERLTRMGCDMGFVQRRHVENRVDALHAARDPGSVGDRRDLVGERSGDDVEADGLAARRAQGAHQRFAQMP